MTERKPDESANILGMGRYDTYELTELEMIELISVLNQATQHPVTGQDMDLRTFTHFMVQQLGTVEDMGDLAVIITIGRRKKK
jgi:hypothetical protein